MRLIFASILFLLIVFVTFFTSLNANLIEINFFAVTVVSPISVALITAFLFGAASSAIVLWIPLAFARQRNNILKRKIDLANTQLIDYKANENK